MIWAILAVAWAIMVATNSINAIGRDTAVDWHIEQFAFFTLFVACVTGAVISAT